MKIFALKLLLLLSCYSYAGDSTTVYLGSKEIKIQVPDGYVDYYKIDSELILTMVAHLIPDSKTRPVCVFVPLTDILKLLTQEEGFMFSKFFILYQSNNRQNYPLLESEFNKMKEVYFGLDYPKEIEKYRNRIDSFLTYRHNDDYVNFDLKSKDLSFIKAKGNRWAYKISVANYTLELAKAKHYKPVLQAYGPANIANRAFSFYFSEVIKDDGSLNDFENDLDTMLNNMTKVIPYDYIDYYDLGFKCIIDEQYKEALNYLNASIALRNDYDEAYFQRSYAKMSLNDKPGSAIDLKKCISVNPKHYNAHLNLGIHFTDLKDYSNAILHATKAIEIEPKDADAYYNRGCTYLKSKRYQESKSDFNKAIELKKQHELSYLNRGIAKYYLNEKDAACLDWEIAAKLGNEQAKKLKLGQCQ